jgi:hypothetical protein
LKHAGIVDKRASRSLKQKQNPAEVEAAQQEIAAQEERGIAANSTSRPWTRPALCHAA